MRKKWHCCYIIVYVYFSYLLCRLQSHQVQVFFTVNVLFFKHCTIKLIQYTLNSRLIRFSSIRILSNIQEHDSQMDKGARSQLIQDHSCHPELTKQSNCLCYIWSKHGDGLCKLPLPRR